MTRALGLQRARWRATMVAAGALALAMASTSSCSELHAKPAVAPAPSSSSSSSPGRAAAVRFLTSRIRPWPSPGAPHTLAVTSAKAARVAIYDNALLALVMLRLQRTSEARTLLTALAELQTPDGGLPFSFVLPRPDARQLYVRTGALAWVGYAAVAYLDASDDPIGRAAIVAMSHRLAAYLLEHQVARPGDPREGLVTGGTGTYRYEMGGTGPREQFVPGDIAWASTEHNIDSFFFLHALARLTGQSEYGRAAERIGRALGERGWNGDTGQLVSGFHAAGTDRTQALDCASWGALFLRAAGLRSRAETAAAAADRGYDSLDRAGSARGHKPYIHKPLIENVLLAEHYARQLPERSWDDVAAIWPEGSAGVALAALRLGATRRAREILDALEPLRGRDGSLPTLTMEIPFEFDSEPSLAGTAWVELVRDELERPQSRQRLWAWP